MTVGQAVAHAHGIINVMRGTSLTAFTPYIQLHTGDPGAAGTANASATTARQQMILAAPSAGSAASSQMSWTNWVPTSETITHASIWDAASAGNFKQSFTVTQKQPSPSDTYNLTVTVSQGPIAA